MTVCPVCGNCCRDNSVHPDFSQCPHCGTAVRRRETIAENRIQSYGKGWIERHSKSRDVRMKTDFMVSVIKRIIPSGKVLDVGCASGILVDRLTGIGYNATGLDWSEEAVEFASRNMKGSFIVGDASLETVPSQTFDLIVASHIIEHLEDPTALLAGVTRLSKPDGYFYTAVPNLLWYSRKPIWRTVSSIFDTDHVVGYSPASLVALLLRHGMTIHDIVTRTHGADLLSAACVAKYRSIMGRGRAATITNNRLGASPNILQSLFTMLASSPVTPVVMYIPNRVSERRLRGVELIVIAKKAKGAARK